MEETFFFKAPRAEKVFPRKGKLNKSLAENKKCRKGNRNNKTKRNKCILPFMLSKFCHTLELFPVPDCNIIQL